MASHFIHLSNRCLKKSSQKYIRITLMKVPRLSDVSFSLDLIKLHRPVPPPFPSLLPLTPYPPPSNPLSLLPSFHQVLFGM